MNKDKICFWCGKEAVVIWDQEMLCMNCWKGVQIDEAKKNIYNNSRPFKIKSLGKFG